MHSSAHGGRTSSRGRKSLITDSIPAIRYQLSEPRFIDMGWTILPTGQDLLKTITYHTEASKPHASWFHPQFEYEEKLYSTGQIFSKFYSDGHAEVFYPNGCLAISVSKLDEVASRVRVFSMGRKDPNGIYHKPVVLALFDSYGNGIIYNEEGNTRICYSQKEGTLYDTPNGRPVKWRWAVALEIDKLGQAIENSNRETKAKRLGKSILKNIFSAKNAKDILQLSMINDGQKETKSTKDPIQTSRRGSLDGSQSKKNSRVTLIKDGQRETKSTKDPIHTSLRGSLDSFQSKKSKSRVTLLENMDSSKGSLATDKSKKIDDSYFPPISSQMKNEGFTNTKTEPSWYTDIVKDVVAPVKFIVLKMNPFLSFRLLDQANINVQFRSKQQSLRVELGVLVDPNIEARVDFVDLAEDYRPDGTCNLHLLKMKSVTSDIK